MSKLTALGAFVCFALFITSIHGGYHGGHHLYHVTHKKVAKVHYVETPIITTHYVKKPVITYVHKPVKSIHYVSKPVISYHHIPLVVKALNLVDNQSVWVAHPDEGYVSGHVIDIGAERISVRVASKTIEATYAQVHYAEEDPNKEVDDNCALVYLNEATLFNNIRVRYHKNKIYTYVANILIAVNPYFEIPKLYTSDTIKSYKGKSLGSLPPHVFAIADKAFRDMRVGKNSQAIIVSGESGAGKTESTKYILRYLCDGSSAGPIEQKILEANPILEAFGNAKTMRNNNSSRFGKFIEIHFGNDYSVVGGYISHYLLEKSRIVSQSKDERNYHIFYQLLAGADNDLRQKLGLTNPDNYNYLRSGLTRYFVSSSNKLDSTKASKDHQKQGPLKDPVLDDSEDFKRLDKSLELIGLDKERRFYVYAIVAAVLHLGNVQFEENPDDKKGGSKLRDKTSEIALKYAATLIGVDPEELQMSLLSRLITSKGGVKGTVYMVPLKAHEANSARDALAKALYAKLFDFIVGTINSSIPFKQSAYYIGVLDIAGFEYFQSNSFEQFCINFCNEKLQQFFNYRILNEEQNLYEKEGLGVKRIAYTDNSDCIDLLEAKNTGIFEILDEESHLPTGTAAHFTSQVHSTHRKHFRISIPRKSKLKAHRELRDEDGFLIHHFAGAVCYQTEKFLDKNNDALHDSLEAIVLDSNNPFVKSLFLSKSPQSSGKGKLRFVSVGAKFRKQLAELMKKLEATGTHFVRCIKPNNKMESKIFEGPQVLNQLGCSGMTSVLELMQTGFPSRVPFRELYEKYKSYLPKDLASLDPRLFCRTLFMALGLRNNDFKFGLTKIFFRPGKFAEFDEIMKSDPASLAQLISKVRKWLVISRLKKAQWCALCVIKLRKKIEYRRQNLVIIQKTVRGYLARKQYGGRIQGLKKLKTILKQLADMKKSTAPTIVSQISEFADLENQVKNLSRRIKNGETVDRVLIEKSCNDLTSSLGGLAKKVKCAMVEQQVREAQRLKEEEERKKEETKRQKAEIERCRREEEERARTESSMAAAADAERKAQEERFIELQRKLEQERRDRELAMRLAQENNSMVEDQSPPSSIGSTGKDSIPAGKYDLSKWKYSELRDVINTSCDLELLVACREEFYRRLKVYHAWKSRNAKKGPDSKDEVFRLPTADHAGVAPSPESGPPRQRYFKIPFKRDVHSVSGWWFAHFDGQFIARQIEMSPNKPALLLLTGRDDMQMCELKLEETGLARKKGAEILEEEFNREWASLGGQLPYEPPSSRGVRTN
ncbi:unconventional myosin-VI [Galendromus occidentalis]|uniref:Unconventional myosin-VI n=1 Tax=Galendromus occidentalis TaxID=34638 RepID=A0AAJ7WJ20_9ACAR|nr:unconventional myosin-VI [Galendromus occidentalis]